MNLGMLGAIGGAGKGLAEVGQANNMREMELFKMQAEMDMRERIADRMATRGAAAIRAKQAGDAEAAKQINQSVDQQKNQNDADAINLSNSGANVSADDIATANAGHPLNAEQRAAYKLPASDPVADARLRAKLSLETGNTDVQSGADKMFNSEINNKSIDNKNANAQQLLDLKSQMLDMREQNLRMNGAAKPTANHQDWQDWAKDLPAGADKSWAAWYRFKTGQLIKEQALIQKTRGSLDLNPAGAKNLQDILDNGGNDQPDTSGVVDYSTYFKK